MKRLWMSLSGLIASVAVLAAILAVRPARAEVAKSKDPPPVLPAVDRPVDFVTDIQPIFQQSCYKCHGPEKHKGELRLDAKQLALNGGTTGPLFEAGHGDHSLIVQRLLGLGDDDRMPLKADPLPPAQIALVKAWIDQGAKWPDSASGGDAKLTKHWAYEKPVRPELPAVNDAGWVRNPIDRFVLARLEKEGLHPSKEASRETLIRRLSLDLIGLPPTPAEVDAFVHDASPDAYERLVDQLLASPHFGERWARPWLDLARYADSNGFEKDNRRVMWKYRDWVIDAMNANMSFRQFTIEQIAGDMLPHPTQSQLIATGFHRNTMLNEEGGVDAGEQRWYTLIDRVNTTASVWLGSTLQCAQCHNHKYDPFSQQDYYRFLAFFDNTDEPTIPVESDADRAKKRQIEFQIADLEAKLKATTPDLEAAQEKWERAQSTAVATWHVLDVQSVKSAHGAELVPQPDGSVLAKGKTPANETYTVVAKSDLKKITGFRLEAMPDDSLPAHGPGAAPNGNFALTEFRVAAGEGESARERVKLSKAVADFSQDQYPVAAAIDGKRQTGWGISPQFGRSHWAVFVPEKPVQRANGEDDKGATTTLVFTLDHQTPYAQHNLGRFRLSVTDAADPAGATPLPEKIGKILAIAADERTEDQKTELAAYYLSIAPELEPVRQKIASLRKDLETAPKVTALVMKERPGKRRPTTDFHVRGAWLQKGERVEADVPKVLPPLVSGEPRNRLGLAEWLVSDDNPLTARVTVNRYWEHLFGIGIVQTAEDFGTQGEAPSHPELLDWLATEFMHPSVSSGQGPWDIKRMIRLIVTSATYRQQSKVSEELQQRDPYNRLLARGPRFRMEAELVRDNALAVAGLLSPKIGGPSVMPYQPDGIWDIPYSGDKWVTSPGEDRHRRGLYTFWRRSAPYPSMTSFDAPSREFCTIRRVRTNTPLQALTVLNDPAFVEAAQALARRVIAEAPAADVTSRLSYGFRLCTARRPNDRERKMLSDLYERELKSYSRDEAAASTLIGGKSAPDGVAPREMAAWTVVANVLLNLDETVTKE